MTAYCAPGIRISNYSTFPLKKAEILDWQEAPMNHSPSLMSNTSRGDEISLKEEGKILRALNIKANESRQPNRLQSSGNLTAAPRVIRRLAVNPNTTGH